MQPVAHRSATKPRSCDAGLWMNLLVAAIPVLVLIAFVIAIYSILTNGPRQRA